MDTNEILTPLAYSIASQIFIELLEGVKYLHEQNPPLIHRDLKPANILLKESKNSGRLVKIADFGLIVLHEYSDQPHTMDRGSPKYTAPEVMESKNYDTKADIYSLGEIMKNLFNIQLNMY
jgi:serine/threonine-protein kinase